MISGLGGVDKTFLTTNVSLFLYGCTVEFPLSREGIHSELYTPLILIPLYFAHIYFYCDDISSVSS